MRVGLILKKWRLFNEIPSKVLAAQIGISTVTLWILEHEKRDNMDGETMTKLINWLFSNDGKGKK